MGGIILEQLAPDDREQFILDNQEAFNYGAMVEFGLRDNRFDYSVVAEPPIPIK